MGLAAQPTVFEENKMYSADYASYKICRVEQMLNAVEEKIASLDKIKEWSTDQEIEYFRLCEERDWLQREFDELYEVIA